MHQFCKGEMSSLSFETSPPHTDRTACVRDREAVDELILGMFTLTNIAHSQNALGRVRTKKIYERNIWQKTKKKLIKMMYIHIISSFLFCWQCYYTGSKNLSVHQQPVPKYAHLGEKKVGYIRGISDFHPILLNHIHAINWSQNPNHSHLVAEQCH